MAKPKINIINGKLPKAKSERKKPLAKATRKVLFTSLDPKVIVLEDINELACKFRGKFNLSLKLKQINEKNIDPMLNAQLVAWETEVNRICILDPVIAVENFVDNEGPPKDFHYVRENISNSFSNALLDPSFLVGCECYPRCSSTNCVCPKNGGGHFAYDRKKRVLLPKGSPIYECNKKCKCSLDCPNRVIQKGLTTRVSTNMYLSIFHHYARF